MPGRQAVGQRRGHHPAIDRRPQAAERGDAQRAGQHEAVDVDDPRELRAGGLQRRAEGGTARLRTVRSITVIMHERARTARPNQARRGALPSAHTWTSNGAGRNRHGRRRTAVCCGPAHSSTCRSASTAVGRSTSGAGGLRGEWTRTCWPGWSANVATASTRANAVMHGANMRSAAAQASTCARPRCPVSGSVRARWSAWSVAPAGQRLTADPRVRRQVRHRCARRLRRLRRP